MAAESPIRHPHDWPVIKLSSICTKIGSGATPKGGQSAYLKERANYALVRSQNVFDRHFSFDGLAFISNEQAAELKAVELKAGDILLNITGDGITFARACQVPNSVLPACVNQHVSIIRPNHELADSGFILSFLTHPMVKPYIESFNAGGSRRAITKGHIQSFELPLPTLQTQIEIGKSLSVLDQKIALNHQINTTLESMAQALFKSWFVVFDPVIDNALAAGNPIPEELKARAEIRADLGDQRKPLPDQIRQQFPDRFVLTEEMGWVPEGWEIAPLSRVATLKTQSAHPSKEPERTWTQFSIPAFDDGMNPSKDVGETIKSGKYKVPKTAILASKLNPQFPRIWMPDVVNEETSVCSTEFMPFVPNNSSDRPYTYSLFCSEIMQTEIANRVTGSTGSRQRVKPKEIAELSILIPPPCLRLAFSKTAGAFFERKSVVQTENLTLAKLRDTLLPKLLSGELRVPSAERQIDEVPGS